MWSITVDGEGQVHERLVASPRSVVIGEVNYPAAMFRWPLADRQAIGVFDVVKAALPDRRFYSTGNRSYVTDPVAKVTNESLDVTENPMPAVIARLKAEVSATCAGKIDNGVVWNDGSTDHIIQTDATSRGFIDGAMTAKAEGMLPPGLAWRSRDNVMIPMTGAQLAQMYRAVIQHVNTCKSLAWTKQAEIEALADVDAAIAYAADPINDRWPVDPQVERVDDALAPGAADADDTTTNDAELHVLVQPTATVRRHG